LRVGQNERQGPANKRRKATDERGGTSDSPEKESQKTRNTLYTGLPQMINIEKRNAEADVRGG